MPFDPAIALCVSRLCVGAAALLGVANSSQSLDQLKDVFEAVATGGEALAKLRGPEARIFGKALKAAEVEVLAACAESLRKQHSSGFRETVELAFANFSEVFESCLPRGEEFARLGHDPLRIANWIADAAVQRQMEVFRDGEGRTILVGLVVLAYERLDRNPEFMAALQRANWHQLFRRFDDLDKAVAKQQVVLQNYALEAARERDVAVGFIREMAGKVARDEHLDLDGMKQAVRNALDIYEKEIAGSQTQTKIGEILDGAFRKAKVQVDKGQSGLARATLRRAAEDMRREEEERRREEAERSEGYAVGVTLLYTRERDIALALYDGVAAASASLELARTLH